MQAAPGETLAGRVTLALLDRRRHLDYLWLALIGAAPSALAVLFGLQSSFEAGGRTWIGFFDKPNLWPQVLLLPLFVFLVRWTFSRVADVGAPRLIDPAPPVVRLFPAGEERARAYLALRHWLASGTLLRLVLVLVVLAMAFDMAELVGVYLSDDADRTGEHDWSVMYLTGSVGKGANLLMVVSAYLVQMLLFVFRFLAIFGLIAHNLFFLAHIWQRRRVASGRPLIRVDLDDQERCLGLRDASRAFNTQVLLLTLGGAFILFSRFANLAVAEGIGWQDVMTWPPTLSSAIVLPDAGQWILALLWVLSMLAVSLPLGVKLLPLAGPHGLELSLTEFLREMLPEGVADRADAAHLARVAGRFAEHAFWPAGDNRAAFLFTFGAMVLLAVLYPLRIADPSLLLVATLLTVALGWGLQRLFMLLLHLPLRFVDPRLVTPAAAVGADSGADVTLRPIRLSVFVSYRRADSRAYARLLHKALLEQVEDGSVFMDVATLRDGQDFVDTIEQSIAESAVLLLIIGPQWLTLSDEEGVRRLDDPDDLVVQEVRLAIEHDLHLIPVLVGGARMPTAAELPPTLRRLWRRQARVLDDSHWDYDVGRLIEALRAIEVEERLGRRFRGEAPQADDTEPGPA